MNVAKQWLLAFLLFAGDNGDRFPDTFDKAMAYAGGKDPGEESDLTTDQFEIVFTGSLKDITAASRTIVLRERAPLQGPDGNRHKTYGFADGHSEVHREGTDGFEKWEQERMQKVR